MKLNKKIMILILAIVGMCIGTTVSNAAIEIKSGTSPHTKITVSTAYEYCYNMRAFSSSLGANSLDPHLTTNADWGAAAYLGMSGYGYVRSAYGQAVSIGENTYNSTTQNATGVMNMGGHYVYTASFIVGRTSTSNNTNLNDNINTKYVDRLSDVLEDNKKGLGLIETKGWFSSTCLYPATSSTYSQVPRIGIVGYGGTGRSLVV